MLRSKDGDENSYKSRDAINNIDWELLTPTSIQYQTMQYYKGLIAMRKAVEEFTNNTNLLYVQFTNLANGAIAVSFKYHTSSEQTIVVINPSSTSLTYTLPSGSWNVYANGTTAGSSAIGVVSGDVTVEGISINVYLNY